MDELTPAKKEEDDRCCAMNVLLLSGVITKGCLLFRGRSRKAYESSASSDSGDAQKKFGNAKAISSDMFFGNNDPDVCLLFVRYNSAYSIAYSAV
jgi:hypothetical protein